MDMETKSCRGCGWTILINYVKTKLMDELSLFACGIRCRLFIRNKGRMQREVSACPDSHHNRARNKLSFHSFLFHCAMIVVVVTTVIPTVSLVDSFTFAVSRLILEQRMWKMKFEDRRPRKMSWRMTWFMDMVQMELKILLFLPIHHQHRLKQESRWIS